jgi:hypothetical protein
MQCNAMQCMKFDQGCQILPKIPKNPPKSQKSQKSPKNPQKSSQIIISSPMSQPRPQTQSVSLLDQLNIWDIELSNKIHSYDHRWIDTILIIPGVLFGMFGMPIVIIASALIWGQNAFALVGLVR